MWYPVIELGYAYYTNSCHMRRASRIVCILHYIAVLYDKGHFDISLHGPVHIVLGFQCVKSIKDPCYTCRHMWVHCMCLLISHEGTR